MRPSTHLVVGLPVVDAHDAAHHLWQYDHVPEVGLHAGRLHQLRRIQLGLVQLGQQGLVLEF